MNIWQIHSAVQQVGFRRFKRGYKTLPASTFTAIDPAQAIASAAKEHKDPTDPYFTYQWYLVSSNRNSQPKRLNLFIKRSALELTNPAVEGRRYRSARPVTHRADGQV